MMRIAYISYEYPPDTATGGIATYVAQASKLMKGRGHEVEVFCASTQRTITEIFDGIIVHRIFCKNRFLFSKEILPVFSARHADVHFDLIESPELSGDGLEIKKAFPRLPLVVKLHTPWYIVYKLNYRYLSNYRKVRFMLAGLKGGRINRRFWRHKQKNEDTDYQITKIADQVQTPSLSLGNIVSKDWRLRQKKIIHVPYPFIPKEELLNIPEDTNSGVVSFVGRLEVRKGIVELVKALPHVFDAVPDFTMRFVGRSGSSHIKGLSMKDYISARLKTYLHRVQFLELKSDEIHRAYKETDICIFPSLWENFPNVCLEAMSAARGIVASKYGGMKDMLEETNAGILVDPYDKFELSKAIIKLLNDQKLRRELGGNARKTLLSNYNAEVIGKQMEANYYSVVNGL